MDADGGPERCAIARQFEHDRAAEAKADGAEALSIDLRQGRQRGERRPAARSELGRVGTKVADERARLGKIARQPALTEHVRGQGDVTEPCQALRHAP
jgi:hypothetical protein